MSASKLNKSHSNRFNWPLYHTFVMACSEQQRRPQVLGSYFQLDFDNGHYLMLWTPLNKMTELKNHRLKRSGSGRLNWSESSVLELLEHIEDNQADFHIEPNTHGIEDNLKVCTVAYEWMEQKQIQHKPTVSKWHQLFAYMEDTDQINKDYLMWRLRSDWD